nr:MAG TPA: hypothetical protein [Bacteriophage sp.]
MNISRIILAQLIRSRIVKILKLLNKRNSFANISVFRRLYEINRIFS